ncbi:alginate export family protein [Gallaecimonas xiamenensis]|uniref:Alginate export domain-containing protein n=1 Tax=Gallaecimonas xiamenensis 3-C-1 TaxID=745411 RepID=K2IXF0_9GAMM|nr:alginate export family protein [Gallaecimonas xiamenensis]EKE75121.1 hypothetical protein B3C1_07591 [Gallaecimonas xiamenensis 3-C-1]
MLLVSLLLAAQSLSTPALTKLRQDEDWSAWCADKPQGYPFKCLRPTADSLLSLGGEVRYRYEFTDDPVWGGEPQDEHGVFTQRYVGFADWHLGSRWRLFGQVTSAIADGRAGGPSIPDQNRLSVQQTFVQYGAKDYRLTLGRQELNLGSGRLLDVREGPNVRRRFDAGVVNGQLGNWHWQGLVARPWRFKTGSFDDRVDHSQGLWGFYGTTCAPLSGNLDLYYFGYRNEHARYAQGQGVELRHTLGTRLFGDQGPWSWNWEFIYQFGRFDGGDIGAWSLASDTRYRFGAPFAPELGLSANVASGDKNPNDHKLGSFNALFPRGNYFSEMALLGPRNFYNLHPYLGLNLTPALVLTTELDFYWRLEKGDGIYGPAGQLLRPAYSPGSRYVGTEFAANVTWTPRRGHVLTAIYGHSFPGPALGDAKDEDFLELTWQYRF